MTNNLKSIRNRIPFQPRDWYWFVAGDLTQAWSSKLGQYVAAKDVPADARPTRILNAYELCQVLKSYGLLGPIEGQSSDGNPPPVGEVIPTKADLKSYAAYKRRLAINAGTVVDGIPIWCDSDSQAAMVGLVVASQINPALTTGWKGRDGNFYQLTSANIVSTAMGMMAYVQVCFSKEATASAGIDADTITTRAQVDALF